MSNISKHTMPAVLILGLTMLVPNSGVAETRALGKAFKISGEVHDIEQQITASGYSFRVELRGLSYRGSVSRTLLEYGKKPNRLTLWIALRNVRFTIRQTAIRGTPGSANCGPLEILLGNDRDLWIAFDLKRQSIKGEPQLVIDRTRFAIPRDNWSIGTPDSVRTSGFGMTRSRVVRALRNGLANNRAQVERLIVKIAPNILQQHPMSKADTKNGASILESIAKSLEEDIVVATAK